MPSSQWAGIKDGATLGLSVLRISYSQSDYLRLKFPARGMIGTGKIV